MMDTWLLPPVHSPTPHIRIGQPAVLHPVPGCALLRRLHRGVLRSVPRSTRVPYMRRRRLWRVRGCSRMQPASCRSLRSTPRTLDRIIAYKLLLIFDGATTTTTTTQRSVTGMRWLRALSHPLSKAKASPSLTLSIYIASGFFFRVNRLPAICSEKRQHDLFWFGERQHAESMWMVRQRAVHYWLPVPL